MDANGVDKIFGRIRFPMPPSKQHWIGDVLELIAPHCDVVVNEYDQIYRIRKDKVEVVWPITARESRARVPRPPFVHAKF